MATRDTFSAAVRGTALVLVSIVASCSAAPDQILGGEAASGDKGANWVAAAAKTDRGDAEAAWVDVDETRPMDEVATSVMLEALAVIARSAVDAETDLQATLARQTIERIEAGDVLLGAVSSASGRDLWHMCRDLERDDCGDVPDDADWGGPEGLREVLAEELDGYQWGNRLYFTLTTETDVEELAGTLVHEVNHVLNRSECSYYRDFVTHEVDDDLAWIEEYRAFFAECVWRRGADLKACVEWADETLVEREYGLEPDLEQVLPEGETTQVIADSLLDPESEYLGAYGWLVPSESVWPEDFEPCD